MKKLCLYIAILMAALWVPVSAQFTHPGCDDLKPADFRITEIFNRSGANGAGASESGIAEPLQMDFHPISKGDSLLVDIYFVERLGKVKHYDAAARKVNTMGTIPVWGKSDNGLMGMALHPDFDRNRWIYLWYAPPIANAALNRRLRLSRMVVTAQNTLDMASEKILIDILGSKTDTWHSGGPMTFDRYGDLWVTVGNNSVDLNPATMNVLSTTDSTQSAEWGPSNTASLRGGIFRIHPDSSAKGYSIPQGNFGEYWAAEWEKKGRADLAAQYRNPAKVLPELYVKGNRSNYSITVHPTKRWLAWGEVNYASINDEFNIVTSPAFVGYPYFHNNNLPTCDPCSAAPNPATPKNNSPLNSGVIELPPAVPGAINNLVNVAISGPLYVYDRNLSSKTKFPPHLHNSWTTFAFSANQMHIHALDSVKVAVTKTTRVDNGLFAAMKNRNVVQAKYGPEGALYILYYDGFYSTINPAVVRVDYLGTCSLPPVSVAGERRSLGELDVSYAMGALHVREPGNHILRIYDMSGTLRMEAKGAGGSQYALSEPGSRRKLEKGVYNIRIKTAKGVFSRNLSLL